MENMESDYFEVDVLRKRKFPSSLNDWTFNHDKWIIMCLNNSPIQR